MHVLLREFRVGLTPALSKGSCLPSARLKMVLSNAANAPDDLLCPGLRSRKWAQVLLKFASIAIVMFSQNLIVVFFFFISLDNSFYSEGQRAIIKLET